METAGRGSSPVRAREGVAGPGSPGTTPPTVLSRGGHRALPPDPGPWGYRGESPVPPAPPRIPSPGVLRSPLSRAAEWAPWGGTDGRGTGIESGPAGAPEGSPVPGKHARQSSTPMVRPPLPRRGEVGDPPWPACPRPGGRGGIFRFGDPLRPGRERPAPLGGTGPEGPRAGQEPVGERPPGRFSGGFWLGGPLRPGPEPGPGDPFPGPLLRPGQGGRPGRGLASTSSRRAGDRKLSAYPLEVADRRPRGDAGPLDRPAWPTSLEGDPPSQRTDRTGAPSREGTGSPPWGRWGGRAPGPPPPSPVRARLRGDRPDGSRGRRTDPPSGA